MATILVGDFLTRASTLLKDTSPQFTRWTQRELVMWLNDGQRAIAKYIPFVYSRIDAIKLVPGTRQSIAAIPAASIVPGDGTAPAAMRGIMLLDIIRNMGADGMTPGVPIRVTPRESQDQIDSAWHSSDGGGVVEHYTFDPRNPKNFYAVPGVSKVVPTWIEVSYIANPIELAVPPVGGSLYMAGDSLAATTLVLDDTYLDDVLNYVMARAYMKDAEYAANTGNVQLYTQLFIQSLNTHVQMMTGTNPNIAFLPFAPNQQIAQAH